MTGLSEELIGKRCIFNLDCPIDYSFHWAVVAHVQKVQNHKHVSHVARSIFSGMFLTNPVKGGRVGAAFVPQFQGNLDMSMLTTPMPNPCQDCTALKTFEETNGISVYVYDWLVSTIDDEEYSGPDVLYKPEAIRDIEITLLYQDVRWYLILDRPAWGREAFFVISRDLQQSKSTRTCHRCLDTFKYKKEKACEFTRHMARKDCTVEEDNDVAPFPLPHRMP